MPTEESANQSWSTVHGALETHAAAAPDHPFLIEDDARITLRRLNESANQLAHGLISHGVNSGDHIALMMNSSVEYIQCWFAIAKTGAVEVPVNTAYKGDMLRYAIETANVKIMIVDAAYADLATDACEMLSEKPVIIVNGAAGKESSGGSVQTLNSLFAACVANPDLDIGGTDPACIIFTSGTTGPSKGVVISHFHEVSFAVFFNEIVSMTDEDTAFNYLPFFHIAAKFLTLGAMLAGGKMALTPVFSLNSFWAEVEKHRATLCIAVGGMCHMLRGLPERSDDAENSLRMIYAVPVPAEFQETFERRFGVTMVEGYGSTESNLVAYSRPGGTPKGSCGKPSPHFDLAILDENCRPLPAGRSGEICVRPKIPYTLMNGYYGMPDKTLEAFDQLWFHTGDRGYLDEQGFLYFQDRIKDCIRRRGENVSSFEVERIINEHPAVSECAVVAAPSDLQEDEVKAVVVRAEDAKLSAEDLFNYCAESLPYFMVPRYIVFRDSLPRTPTQKIRKVELRNEGVSEDCWDCESYGLKIARSGVKRI